MSDADFRVYVVGDRDPTPTDGDETIYCNAIDPKRKANCTWPYGHEYPQHVSGDAIRVTAVWPTVGSGDTPAK